MGNAINRGRRILFQALSYSPTVHIGVNEAFSREYGLYFLVIFSNGGGGGVFLFPLSFQVKWHSNRNKVTANSFTEEFNKLE